MGKALVIVESPAKIKTLQKFLGSGFSFASSIGHIRDLPESGFGIDTDNDFEPQYEIIHGKNQVVETLKAAAKECDTVYLCPDPDREGEAIAWHIASILPKGTNIKRASFLSLTKSAVVEALENPGDIDIGLVNAQQARRLLDRIVGYKISPILARRIQRGRGQSVSAGRVQSVALKLVVDREKKIEVFDPIEYWNLSAIVVPHDEATVGLSTNLYSVDGKRVEKEPVEGKDFTIINTKDASDAIIARLNNANYRISQIDRKEKRRNPVPPFITSTLQQEASRHFRFSASRTMNIAQGLYEGIDMDNEGTEGLITYMRTDSVRVAPEAISMARDYVTTEYGKEYLPEKPRMFTASKSAQDAHEAIRPTNLLHPPEKIKNFLSKEQYSLYSLIWKRFVASQMMPVVYDTVAITIEADKDIILRATGSSIKFQGFLVLYEEKTDEATESDLNIVLPDLAEGLELKLQETNADQSFTRAPPRFSEASLVRELEKSGIGRPSTYASIMNKIQSREYTVKDNNRLIPTELGMVIAQMLEDNFPQIMNISFTAHMEDDLELIAENNTDWKALIRKFWEEFIPVVELAEKQAFVPKILTDIDCPKCGTKLQKVWSRSKYFYGCSAYPECDFTATSLEELEFNKKDYAKEFNWEQTCPVCKSPMTIRHGRYGAFLGCSEYPKCRGIINIPKEGEEVISIEDMPKCPAIGCDGRLIARKSRFGKIFYSCSNFPDCNVIANSLEEIGKKYPSHPKTPYVKKERKKKQGKTRKKAMTEKTKTPRKTTMPPSILSPELSAVVGGDTEMPRTTVIKKVWEYIKAHDLQDPKNKRMIVPDAALAKIFGNTEPLEMMKLAGVLNKHLTKKS